MGWCGISGRALIDQVDPAAGSEGARPGEAADGGAPTVAMGERAKASFTATSLTILSIIQGVALASLGSVVAGHVRELTPTQWLMAGVTFFLLIMVWNHMAVDAIAFVWIPDFLDSALPFLIGVTELFVVQAILMGVQVWLFGMVFTAVCAVIELQYVRWRVERWPHDAQVLAFVRRRWRVHGRLNLIALVLFPFLALGSLVGIFEDAPGAPGQLTAGAVLLIGGWLVGYAISGQVAWRASCH
jgi:hypothetical protein